MILVSVLLGYLAAVCAPLVYRFVGKNTGWVLAAVPAAMTVYFTGFLGEVAQGNYIRQVLPWVPGFDVNLSFMVDGLSIFFALIVTVVGTFILIYSSGYLGRNEQAGRFYASLVAFMASMVGMVFADNVITLYVFFELTSFTSFFLIGFHHESATSRRAAWQALLVTNIGGLALLASVIMMATLAGSFEISEILSQPEALQSSGLYVPILLCLLAAAFTKSAQYPFHFWLPNAMAAPTPVSAYLHSATMVKAGIYLLARFSPALSGTPEWIWIVTAVGAFTMLMSAWLSLSFTDLKQILAYSTVMALGLLTMLLGMGGEAAITACIVFIVVHALYKASLFMVAGAIDHETGTREVNSLSGLRKTMPIAFGAAIVAGLSMAGFPPFIGFIGKEIVYEAALQHGTLYGILVAVSLLANVAIVGAAGVVAVKPFLGDPSEAAGKASNGSVGLWLGAVVLAGLGLIYGLLPGLVDEGLIGPAAAAVMGAPSVDVHLALWHGFNIPLLLSGITVALGLGVYYAWDKIRESRGMAFFKRVFAQAPDNGYDVTVDGVMAFGRKQTSLIQSGVMRHGIITAFAFTGLLVMITMIIKYGITLPALDSFGDILAHEWMIGIAMIVAGVSAALVKSRIVAVLVLGVSGFSIALIYINFGAPDLAMTQFLVETLTVVIIALVLIKLPKDPEVKHTTAGRMGKWAIAGLLGLSVTVVMFAVLQIPFTSEVVEFYRQNSYLEAHGRNIVNVILVDFRGIDTLGETIVISMAGLSIFSILMLTVKEKWRGKPVEEDTFDKREGEAR